MNSEATTLAKPDLWGWGNEVLYRMCREAPGHTSHDVIAGKVWLIGRAYATAMERGAGGYADIYSTRVVPMMMDSDIDHWIESVRPIERVTTENVTDVLCVHQQVTELFNRITGLEKRSLASKYLHFHQPSAFFIFDSIANAKIRDLLKGRRFTVPAGFDTPYVEFVNRCLWYRDNVFEPALERECTPRELDQHLLGN
jgi:hypothetical protein